MLVSLSHIHIFSIAEVLTGVENAYNLFGLTVKNPGFQAGLLLR